MNAAAGRRSRPGVAINDADGGSGIVATSDTIDVAAPPPSEQLLLP